jgi:hypothetical protein
MPALARAGAATTVLIHGDFTPQCFNAKERNLCLGDSKWTGTG